VVGALFMATLPETKGRSLEQIQRELNPDAASARTISHSGGSVQKDETVVSLLQDEQLQKTLSASDFGNGSAQQDAGYRPPQRLK